MKNTAQNGLITGLCLILGGCAAFSPTFASHPTPKRNTPSPVVAAATPAPQASSAQPAPASRVVAMALPAEMAPPVMTDSGIPFATDRQAVIRGGQVHFNHTNMASPWPEGGGELVGLYGEVPNAPIGDGRFEGSANLWQLTDTAEGGCFDPDIAPDGSIMVLASTQHRRTSDIFTRSVRGRTMTRVTSDPADDVMPMFGPDAKRIAFASNRSGNWDVFVISIDGGPAMQLTDDNDHELHPTWSPDGQRIAYCKLGSQSGRWEIWVIDLQSRVHQFIEYGLFPRWNPDPALNKIAFQRARERGSRLFSVWTIDYVNGEALHPTEIVSAANAAAMHPAWSPDGSRLVFVTVLDPDQSLESEPYASDIWVVNVDGKDKTNLTNGQFRNLYPVWVPNSTIYFLSNRSGEDNIWAVATGRMPLTNPTDESGLVGADEDAVRP